MQCTLGNWLMASRCERCFELGCLDRPLVTACGLLVMPGLWASDTARECISACVRVRACVILRDICCWGEYRFYSSFPVHNVWSVSGACPPLPFVGSTYSSEQGLSTFSFLTMACTALSQLLMRSYGLVLNCLGVSWAVERERRFHGKKRTLSCT